MLTTPTAKPYQLLNEELAKADSPEAKKSRAEEQLYTFKFKAPSGRWFQVTASDLTIQELLIPCKQNRFNPLLAKIPSIVPNPLPPCLQSKEQKGKEAYPEAA